MAGSLALGSIPLFVGLIVVLPVLFEGDVKAVIELASLDAFVASHISFLEQLADIVGREAAQGHVCIELHAAGRFDTREHGDERQRVELQVGKPGCAADRAGIDAARDCNGFDEPRGHGGGPSHAVPSWMHISIRSKREIGVFPG